MPETSRRVHRPGAEARRVRRLLAATARRALTGCDSAATRPSARFIEKVVEPVGAVSLRLPGVGRCRRVSPGRRRTRCPGLRRRSSRDRRRRAARAAGASLRRPGGYRSATPAARSVERSRRRTTTTRGHSGPGSEARRRVSPRNAGRRLGRPLSVPGLRAPLVDQAADKLFHRHAGPPGFAPEPGLVLAIDVANGDAAEREGVDHEAFLVRRRDCPGGSPAGDRERPGPCGAPTRSGNDRVEENATLRNRARHGPGRR